MLPVSLIMLFTLRPGPEISVASTKAMCSQLTALLLLALHWGKKKGVIDNATYSRATADLQNIPSILEAELPAMRSRAQELSRIFSEAHSFFFLGRGTLFPIGT